MATWASEADVTTFTGVTVTTEQLNIAQLMIESLINRVHRTSDSDRKDYYWLRRAVAWQAKYVSEHPEIIDQVRVQSLSQDGFSVTYSGDDDGGSSSARHYSPVALRLLDNLHHGSNTSLRVNSSFQPLARGRGRAQWRPLRRGLAR